MAGNPVLVLTLLSLWIVIGYWIWFYWCSHKFGNHKNHEYKTKDLPRVSIIISCKNEANNIYQTVDSILKQDYSDFELIVIDDFSTDDTLEILKSINNPKLKFLSSSVNAPGKKRALHQAIMASENELLLFTDADCRPKSDKWILSMVSKFHNSDIVLGYGPIKKKDSLLNLFQEYETWLTAVQYFTYAISGVPYMGVGRNLMYRKSVYLKNKGFERHLDVVSGDDDLFISEVGRSNNIGINIDPNSFMVSEAKGTINEFLKQKSRHISTSTRYSLKHQLLLGLFALSQWVFHCLIIYSMITHSVSWTVIISLLISKYALQSILHFKWTKILKSNRILLFFPILDILIFIYYITLPIYKLIHKSNEW